ncbi:glycoside hydrolase family 16 protein [Dactylosporangium sp. NPDC049140]|uniref:glycoside hydrolase family 16 protein n=1 Tax=Dactylosporangium sp. NPDC049140 TaxID=3155647 RepID=UPI0033E8E3C4
MLRRFSAVLVVLTSAALSGLIFPERVDAAAPDGWRPVFSNSFDDAGTLPTGCSAYDGAPEGAQASYFRPEAVTVSGGHLSLALHRRTYGGKPFVTGEVRCVGAAQQFGRYEFRALVPVGAGIDSMALLRPVDRAAAQHGSQLEIMAKPGDEQAVVSNSDGAGTTTNVLTGPFRDWHTYVIEWAPSGFKIFVDGTQRSLDPAVSTEPRWFGFAVTTGDRAGTPGSSTALPAEFQIDYLRIWSFEPTDLATPAPVTKPSTREGAMPSGPPPNRHWSLWLAVSAVVTAALALFALVIHKTRPHRPKSSHRA